MAKKNVSIYDNIYGFIKFDKKYENLINNPYFLRLHDIKQMGLTHFIFPDCLHTRYSHSLGVYFIVSEMINNQEILINPYVTLKDADKELLKLSALLHDVGHFPLSHTIERALEKYLEEVTHKADNDYLIDKDDLINKEKLDSHHTSRNKKGAKLHEQLGAQVIENTSLGEDLEKLIKDIDLSLNIYDVSNIFQGITPKEADDQLINSYIHRIGTNLMHSQLDADRLDYLLRDSSFSGVKSGAIDFDKLLDEIRYDNAKIGVNRDGVRVLEQFFMARFAAYSQIPFNKHVQSLDYMACDFYYRLLKCRENNTDIKIYDYHDLIKVLKTKPEDFLTYVDKYFDSLVIGVEQNQFNLKDCPHEYVLKQYAHLIHNHRRLKVVWQEEKYMDSDSWGIFLEQQSLIKKAKDNIALLAHEAGVREEDIIIPEKELEVKIIESSKDKDPVYIFDDGDRDYREHILEVDYSILNDISSKNLYINRIFTFDEEKQHSLCCVLKRWATKL